MGLVVGQIEAHFNLSLIAGIAPDEVEWFKILLGELELLERLCVGPFLGAQFGVVRELVVLRKVNCCRLCRHLTYPLHVVNIVVGDADVPQVLSFC